MSKFKVGDKVVRVDSEGGWEKEIPVGHCYTVLNEEDGFINVLSHDGNGWLFDIRFELYEEKEKEMVLTSSMTAEQIRDEILRIDTRIEEAKKDIENAEKERDSLVEKLREKGFVLAARTSTNNNSSQKLTVGDVVRITSYNKEYHDCNCIDQTAEVFKVDNSARPYYVRTESDDYFWCTPEEVEKI